MENVSVFLHFATVGELQVAAFGLIACRSDQGATDHPAGLDSPATYRGYNRGPQKGAKSFSFSCARSETRIVYRRLDQIRVRG